MMKVNSFKAKNSFLFCFFVFQFVVFAQKPDVLLLKEEFLFEEGKFFAQCHASTMEETKDGILLSSWFGGTHEGNKDVVIWGSSYDGEKWSVPVVWADGVMDNGVQYPCWNPVLFRAKGSSTIHLYYKVGNNPREWWGMFKTSNDGGKSWSKAKKLPKQILGPIKNRPLQLENGTVLSPSSIEVSEERWIAHIEISRKKQKKWRVSPIDNTSAYNVIQPSILIHNDGKLQVLCRSKEGFVMTAWSSDKGKTWSSLTKTSLVNPNSAIDAIRVQENFFMVYNPDVPGKDWWEGRTKLRLAYSTNGIDWIDVLSLENQQTGEYSYPTIFLDSQNFIHVLYTYNRKNIKHLVIKNK